MENFYKTLIVKNFGIALSSLASANLIATRNQALREHFNALKKPLVDLSGMTDHKFNAALEEVSDSMMKELAKEGVSLSDLSDVHILCSINYILNSLSVVSEYLKEISDNYNKALNDYLQVEHGFTVTHKNIENLKSQGFFLTF